jgi:hypothetical protein
VTIMGGSPKGTPITSDPTGAEVYIDGKPAGKTPVTVVASPPLSNNVDIEYPDYEAFRKEIRQAFKRVIHPLFFMNLLIGGLPGFITDIATGNMYQYGFPLHVKLNAAQSDKVKDPLVYFRIPELTAPAEQSLLVVFREPYADFLYKREDFYLDGKSLSLKDAECKTIKLQPGTHSIGISADKLRSFTLDAGATVYFKMEAQHVGTEIYGPGYRIQYFKLLNLKTEEEAIREAYYLLKRK